MTALQIKVGTCVHCNREVESGTYLGKSFFYETVSGDDGGMYDICTGDTAINETHKLGVQE